MASMFDAPDTPDITDTADTADTTETTDMSETTETTANPLNVLLLGGTAEGRALAAGLAQVRGVSVTTSLAGRVKDPARLHGQVRVGGFGGVNGLMAHLLAHSVDAVIDATHPFAAEMTRSAAKACSVCEVPLVRVERPAWVRRRADQWHEVDTVAEAAAAADRLGTRLLVTTGRQEAARFADVQAYCLLRSVEPPDPPLPAKHEVLLDKGPFAVAAEIALLTDKRIDVVVTKNSGGGATIAKISAARELGLPVVMVRRPPLPQGLECVPDPEGAIEWVHRLIAGRRSPDP